jgi:hypothetical protein
MYYIRFSADEFIKNVSPNLKFNLPWLIQRAEKFEERMNASAKTEVSLSSLCVQYYDFLSAKYLKKIGFRIFACFCNSRINFYITRNRFLKNSKCVLSIQSVFHNYT